jgi:hypothetical protein
MLAACVAGSCSLSNCLDTIASVPARGNYGKRGFRPSQGNPTIAGEGFARQAGISIEIVMPLNL